MPQRRQRKAIEAMYAATPATSQGKSKRCNTTSKSWRLTLRSARYKKRPPSASPITPNATRRTTDLELANSPFCVSDMRPIQIETRPECQRRGLSPRRREKAVADDGEDHRHDVMRHDLLAFLVAASLITHRNLIDDLGARNDTTEKR